MEKSGVKTRSSEQAMVHVEAYISMVTGSSSEEDSEIDDQSYSPRGACSNLAGLCCHIVCMVSCIAMSLISLDMLCVNATCSVSNYHICELCIAILLQDIIYVNYTILSCCKGIIYVNYAMPCCLAKRHICELYHAVLFCISHCFCRQCLYIQLLFLCISHLNW